VKDGGSPREECRRINHDLIATVEGRERKAE